MFRRNKSFSCYCILLIVATLATLILEGLSSPVPQFGQRQTTFDAGKQQQVSQPLSAEGSWASSEFTPWHNETRLRDKELRILAIKQYVLNTLGYGNRAPSSSPSSSGQIPTQQQNPSSPFSGKLQTFFASCGLPSNVELDTWKMPGLFHIFFNVSPEVPQSDSTPAPTPTPVFNPFQPSASSATTATVPLFTKSTPASLISAKLKLYKKGIGSAAESAIVESPTSSQPCNDTSSSGRSDISIEQPTPLTTLALSRNTLNFNPLITPDERIRVSVYWYTIPPTKHHYKKKLLDTKMLSVKDAEWIEFDIHKAVKEWIEGGTNYGLAIEVENEDDDLIDANRFFANVNCQNPTNVSGVNRGLAQGATLSMATPILEICTLSIPSQQPTNSYSRRDTYSSSQIANNPFRQSITGNGGRGSFPWQNDASDHQASNMNFDHHRTRHHHGISKHQATDSMTMQQDDSTAANVETTTKFELDPNHPLRHIFATAPTKFGRHSRNGYGYRRKFSRHHHQDDESSTGDDNDGQVKKVIIENIFVEPSSSSTRRNSRSVSSKKR